MQHRVEVCVAILMCVRQKKCIGACINLFINTRGPVVPFCIHTEIVSAEMEVKL